MGNCAESGGRENALITILPTVTRNAHLWFPGYVGSRLRQRHEAAPPSRVWLTIADHFEPYWRGADELTAQRRVQIWRQRWPEISRRHQDSAGRSARYTFFYPEEEYRPDILAMLAEMVETGVADVEVHIHHDGEGQEDFVDRIRGFTSKLHHRHGLLRQRNGKILFGFIHGNWALDNSDPSGRWCGLNNELTLLRELGCYADFTMPSAPSPTQTRLVNTIYWATDDPHLPKSHDSGAPVTVGGSATGDLMILPGPLGVNWRGERYRGVPCLESGELAAYARPCRYRARLWLRYAPRLGDNIFIKLFTHGAQERNSEVLLGGDLDRTFDLLQSECMRHALKLYLVSAWEMWRVVEEVRQERDPLQALDLVSSTSEMQRIL